jgi:ADP-ribose pyrophosphatase
VIELLFEPFAGRFPGSPTSRSAKIDLVLGRLSSQPGLVRHPPSVIIVAIEGDEIVLVRQSRPGAPEPTLELPSGKMRAGETLEQAAHRELGEECGLQADAFSEIGSFWAAPAYSTEVVHVLEGVGLSLHPDPPAPDDDEDIVVERRPLADLPLCLTDGTSIAAFALWRAK